MLPLFVVFLSLSLVMPSNILWGFFIAATFFAILGVKNLILIKRTEIYELLVITLFFMIAVWFFSNTNIWNEKNISFLVGALPGAAFFMLLYGLSRYIYTQTQEVFAPLGALPKRLYVATIGGFALLAWEGAVLLLFLPLPFFYQVSLFFLPSALLTELSTDYIRGTLTRRKLLSLSTILFVASILILASAEWGI